MGRTLKQRLDRLPQVRRTKIDERASELIDEELSLRDLRKALERTQIDVAKKMGVGQDAVSRYEQRTDLMLSTLERYVSAMGGTLSIIAEFPDRNPVRVRRLSQVGEDSRMQSAASAGRHSAKSKKQPTRRRRASLPGNCLRRCTHRLVTLRRRALFGKLESASLVFSGFR
jgi:transcriptional regulator with XRE-family HTH domain